MRLKSLPQGWHEKVQEDSKDCVGKANAKKISKYMGSKKKPPYKLRTQSYGSFEAILELTEQGTYRIKEVLS